LRLERTVFRISRGIIFTRFTELPPAEGERKRCMFMILYPKSMRYLGGKLRTLIETFSPFVFELPLNSREYDIEMEATAKKIEEYSSLLSINTLERKSFMVELVEPYSKDCRLTRLEYLKAFTVK